MKHEERALCFPCGDAWLYGILSLPAQPLPRGVVIVVGGPQYRAGSHRQFTLLARDFASHGFPVLRFDYRGMGDSEGQVRKFDEIDDDLRRAIDCFFDEVPALKDVAIWGLCDGASAALLYAHQDSRVTGVALANPWVRTEEGIARAYLKHYYLARLFSAEFWKKLGSGSFQYAASIRSFWGLARSALARTARYETARDKHSRASLPDRMCDGLKHFRGRVLLIMSGNDLTAKEFSDLAAGSPQWRKQLKSPRVSHIDLPEANHTFSRREWREKVAAETREWLRTGLG